MFYNNIYLLIKIIKYLPKNRIASFINSINPEILTCPEVIELLLPHVYEESPIKASFQIQLIKKLEETRKKIKPKYTISLAYDNNRSNIMNPIELLNRVNLEREAREYQQQDDLSNKDVDDDPNKLYLFFPFPDYIIIRIFAYLTMNNNLEAFDKFIKIREFKSLAKHPLIIRVIMREDQEHYIQDKPIKDSEKRFEELVRQRDKIFENIDYKTDNLCEPYDPSKDFDSLFGVLSTNTTSSFFTEASLFFN